MAGPAPHSAPPSPPWSIIDSSNRRQQAMCPLPDPNHLWAQPSVPSCPDLLAQALDALLTPPPAHRGDGPVQTLHLRQGPSVCLVLGKLLDHTAWNLMGSPPPLGEPRTPQLGQWPCEQGPTASHWRSHIHLPDTQTFPGVLDPHTAAQSPGPTWPLLAGPSIPPFPWAYMGSIQTLPMAPSIPRLGSCSSGLGVS